MDASSRNAASALTDASAEAPLRATNAPSRATTGERGKETTPLSSDLLEGEGPYARLFREGYRFNFFQAVRLVEQLFPQAPPVGKTTDFAGERLCLRPSSTLVFPAADVRRVERVEAGEDVRALHSHVRLTATFLGLYGVDAPLPTTLTEPADLVGEDGAPSALRHFLDVFNHRLYAFFYRSWKKHRPLLHGLRPGQYQPDREDVHARRFLALAGLGTPGALARPLGQVLVPRGTRILQREGRSEGEPSSGERRSANAEERRPILPPMRLAAFAGLLSRRTRSAEGLRALLAGFFEGIPVRIVENVPRWIPIQNRPCMGSEEGKAARLGVNASIGERVYDRSTKFRIELGPMDLATFRALMPGEEKALQLQALVRLYAPDHLAYEVKLTLRPEAVHRAQLGVGEARLGRSAVLGSSAGQAPERVFDYTDA